MVGVNGYTEGGEGQIETLRIDAALERKQIGRLQAVRASRDGEALERTLSALREFGRHPLCPGPSLSASALRGDQLIGVGGVRTRAPRRGGCLCAPGGRGAWREPGELEPAAEGVFKEGGLP